MEMEWKKIARMEYGKIVFHSIPCPADEVEPLSLKYNLLLPIIDYKE